MQEGLGRKKIQPKFCCRRFRLEPVATYAIFRFSDGRDRCPSFARFPSDVHGRSTTDDTGPNNAAVRRSDRAGDLRLRGCARRCYGLLYPISLPLFRPHVGNAICHRRARAVLPPRTTRAPMPLTLRLLFFQIFDSRLSPLFFGDRTWSPPC